MSAPYDRPAPGWSAGGCYCDWCGIVFMGAEWHDGCCAVCLRDRDASLAEDAKRLSPEGVAARAEGIAETEVGAQS